MGEKPFDLLGTEFSWPESPGFWDVIAGLFQIVPFIFFCAAHFFFGYRKSLSSLMLLIMMWFDVSLACLLLLVLPETDSLQRPKESALPGLGFPATRVMVTWSMITFIFIQWPTSRMRLLAVPLLFLPWAMEHLKDHTGDQIWASASLGITISLSVWWLAYFLANRFSEPTSCLWLRNYCSFIYNDMLRESRKKTA